MSIERFLRQRAVDIMMDGTYMLSNWYDPQGRLRTFACRATRVSPFRMIVEVPVVGKVGDRPHLLLPGLRQLRGHDQRHDEGRSPARTRDDPGNAGQARGKAHLAGEEGQGPLQHQRGPEKSALRSKRLAIHPDARRGYRSWRATSSTSRCRALRCLPRVQPPTGTPLAIGACIGRVMRHIPNGFAVKFVKEQSRDELNRLIVRTALGLSASFLRAGLVVV